MTQIINSVIEFYPALIINDNSLPKNSSKNALKIGAWADSYASLSRYENHFANGKIEKIKIQGYAWKTALKILSFAIFILPAVAYLIKNQYKQYCLKHLEFKSQEALKPKPLEPNFPNPEEKLPAKDLEQKIPESTKTQADLQTQNVQSANVEFYSYNLGQTKLSLKTGNITQDDTEVLVNAANDRLVSGRGVCGAFKQDAGEEIFTECSLIKKELGDVSAIPVGHAVLTTSGLLKHDPVKAILHTVGPTASEENRKQLLIDAIENSLKISAGIEVNEKYISSKLPQGEKYRSITFPAISTGIFDYPLAEAAQVTAETVIKFAKEHPTAFDRINFVFLDPDHPSEKGKNTGKAYQMAFENALLKNS